MRPRLLPLELRSNSREWLITIVICGRGTRRLPNVIRASRIESARAGFSQRNYGEMLAAVSVALGAGAGAAAGAAN